MAATLRPGFGGGNGTTNSFGGTPLSSEQLIRSVSEMASTSAGRSTKLFDAGISNLDDVTSYLKKIVHGDREEMYRSLSPEIGAVTDQYDTAYKNVLERAPRGGGRTSAAIGLKTAEAGDVGRLIASARPQAIAQLQQFIAQLIGLSQGQESLAIGANSTALQGRVGKDQMNAEQWQQIGLGIGQMLAMGYGNKLAAKL